MGSPKVLQMLRRRVTATWWTKASVLATLSSSLIMTVVSWTWLPAGRGPK